MQIDFYDFNFFSSLPCGCLVQWGQLCQRGNNSTILSIKTVKFKKWFFLTPGLKLSPMNKSYKALRPPNKLLVTFLNYLCAYFFTAVASQTDVESVL